MSFINSLGKKHLKRSVSFITLWDEYATAHINKNNSNYGNLRRHNIYCDLLGLYSEEENVTYVYSIDGYPTELENSYRTTLRGLCKTGVRISFVSHFEKHVIKWNSTRIRAKLRTWKIIEKDDSEVDEYNLYQNLNQLDNQDWRKASLVYLSTAELRRKRKMFQFRSFMLISGKRGEDFNNSVSEVTALCSNIGIKLSRVIGDIPDYLKVISPFVNTYDDNVLSKVGHTIIPDELIARFNTYAQGTIGRRGKYWGTDIYSGFPCLKVVKKNTESAENWLITAETGGGKSFFVKVILVQLLADNKFKGTVMDIEGFEYTYLANYLSGHDTVVRVNMSEGTGAYYDPVEIILTGNPELDTDMYSLSVSFTLSLFKCLLGTTVTDEWVDIVITDAISYTYASVGVDASDPSTWTRSKGKTLFDVYDTLKALKTSGDVNRAVNTMFSKSLYDEKMGTGKSMTQNDVNRLITNNGGYQEAIDMCIAKLSRYFEVNGVRASLFRNRITIETVRDAKLVVCSFGMAGKSPSSVDPIQMSLMQLYAANISHLRSIFGKNDGLFNFKLWEEFQRWGGFPDADKTINVALTGGRKLGDVNIIITNNVREMLDNDRFGVFGNLTSIAIGAIGDAKTRKDLCERLSIPHLQEELDTIADNNKDLSDYITGDTLLENAYAKAFLIGLDRTVYTVARMSIPSFLAESKIFRTGIDKDVPEEVVYEE